MKYLKFFESFSKPHEKVGEFRTEIKSLMGDDYRKKTDFEWDVNNDDIKIFFDITEFSDPHQTLFGKGIILWDAFKNWLKGNFKKTLNVVEHVGFVFKNNDVLHATGKGVAFDLDYQDIMNNPHRFVIYRIPNAAKEEKIRQLGQELIKRLKDTGIKHTYDSKGIVRQILPGWISRIFLAEKNDNQFFCSELVCNLLNKAGVVTVDQLKAVYERSEIDIYDEISPQKLFKLIVEIGVPAKIIKL